MVKTIILSVDAGAAAVTGGAIGEQDGAGGYQDWTATGAGVFETSEAAGDKVGLIKQGIVELDAAAPATFNSGDQVEAVSATTIQAFVAGDIVGTVVDTKTTTASDTSVKVYVNYA